MKAHIITIHHITNFGSVFQATALCQYLNDIGVNTEIIDYRPAYYDAGRSKLKAVLGKILNLRAFNSRKKKYNQFIQKNEVLSENLYLDYSKLEELDNSEDIFISGGDQLWNTHHPCGSDLAYKLMFIKKGKKVAYGTSIGRDNLSEQEWRELGRAVSDYLMIGLREQSTVAAMQNEVQFTVEHVLDPVALYEKQWYEDKFIKERPIDRKYAVLYLIRPSTLLDQTIEYLHKHDYYIVQVSGFTSKSKVDKLLKDSGPDEILNYIYHADFVLSGSFHATLFSILFNKKFATILPETNTNARIENLVALTHLENRIIHDESDIEGVLSEINYIPVNRIIDEKRESSKRFIEKMVEK